MQQNYINPETSPLPDLAQVKRSLEYRNYIFNQQQIERRSDLIRRQKMQEAHRSALQRERTIMEIKNQKMQQLKKKYQVQENLQKAYDNQIHSREKIKTLEKSNERFYTLTQKELLENQQRSRINDMTKIYNIGSSQKQRTNYFPQRKLLTEGCEDSLDTLKNQSFPQFRSHNFMSGRKMEEQNPNDLIKTQSLKGQQKNSLSSIDQPSLQDSRAKKYSAVNLEYADYLKREIQRRQKTKQEQNRKQLEKDRTWIEKQNRNYYENLEEMNYNNQKKKYEYAAGLDKQLTWKKEYQQRL